MAYSWRKNGSYFVNPYNFAPVHGDVKRKSSEKGNLTGRIECKLTAVTPLAFPDHEKVKIITTEKGDKHPVYPFYSINENKRLIPGSSLRGTVRSMFETVTNSCLSVNNNNILSARSTFPRKPAVLIKENGHWSLYKAEMHKHREDEPIGKNQFIRTWYDIRCMKQTEFVFTKHEKVEVAELDKAVEDYKACLEIYRKNVEKSSRNAQRLFKDSSCRLDEMAMNPLFYEEVSSGEKKFVYLSPAQMSRSVFHNKLNDLLGSHKSCSLNDDDTYCEACDLFGIINSKNNTSLASSVRFSDAYAVDFISAGNHTLKELASPKTTAVEFYTERPEGAKVWNYDYMTTDYECVETTDYECKKNKKPCNELTDISIKGRKHYLHTQNGQFDTNEKTKRNSTMELADKGSTFAFTVYFENITQKQLERLVWTLTLGENSDSSKRLYKVGHGKPLGLGSAKITVSKVEVRDYYSAAMMYGLRSLDIDELISSSGIKPNLSVRKLIDFDTTKGMVVSYPVAQDKTAKTANSSASHQWFNANRTTGEGRGTAWVVNDALPDIVSEDIRLPVYEKVYVYNPQSDNSRSNYGSNSSKKHNDGYNHNDRNNRRHKR